MIKKEHSRKQDKQQFNNITKHASQQPQLFTTQKKKKKKNHTTNSITELMKCNLLAEIKKETLNEMNLGIV